MSIKRSSHLEFPLRKDIEATREILNIKSIE